MSYRNQGTLHGLLTRAAGVLLAAVAVGAAASHVRAFDARSIEPSVYKIYAFFPEKGDQYSISSGTGFLIAGRRQVVTNVHVVAGGQRIYIAFREKGEAKLVEAELGDIRPDVDLALLTAREDLPGTPLEVGDYEPEKLADVIAIGFPGAANLNKELVPESDARGVPLTDLEATVTTGVVSRMTFSHLKLTAEQLLSARTVQHNAAINPGSSGGPLLDACGRVVGVNTLQGVDAQGVFFSIHAGELVRFLRDEKVAFAVTSRGCSGGVLASTFMPLVVSLAATLILLGVVMLRRGRGRAVIAAVSPTLARIPGLASAGQSFAGWRARQAAAPAGEERERPLLCLRPADGAVPVRLHAGAAGQTLGRGPGADIVVSDDTVSKLHARIVYDRAAGTLRIQDLGSSNGTYLNGRPVSQTEDAIAQRGGRVRFGTLEFVVAEETPADRTMRGWMLSGFDAAGQALQFELKPPLDAAGRPMPATWTLGRDPARADIVIDDPSVSSLHAEISVGPGQVMQLRDSGSMNGTHVDGANIAGRPVPLDRAGQEIVFGMARFRLSHLAT